MMMHTTDDLATEWAMAMVTARRAAGGVGLKKGKNGFREMKRSSQSGVG